MLIAEIGINHNGSVEIAKKLILQAKALGWDYVKFQKRTPDLCVPEKYKSQVKDSIFGQMTYLEYRDRIEFGKAEFDEIDAFCKANEMKWTASAFDIPSAEFIKGYGVDWIKIPSCAITDLELLRSLKYPTIISTGMSTESQIVTAAGILGSHLYGIAHCTSSYPCPPSEANLRMIPKLKEWFPSVSVGYSGHEIGLPESIAAIALGAKFVERHITLDRSMKGSDHAASLEADGMAKLKKYWDTVRAAMGDGEKKVYASELAQMEKLRMVR
jgi:N-acetylneuraminate synthase